MFDFFKEVIEFLSQVASIFNFSFDQIFTTANLVYKVFQKFQNPDWGIPTQVYAALAFYLSGLMFDFFRGRGRSNGP